ncbi:MAG: alpha/beta fold hydrolase [Leptolyngbyaceae cyanobacterium MAG.088]|nr:alpha/beta fold hydrolase [Leptolyngbyaceae cyanobacterium MAG.088]
MKVLWCLHGNLQQSDVWDSLFWSLRRDTEKGFFIEAINLWERLTDDCWEWSAAFCDEVKRSSTFALSQNYLLGYSLGGRLAFHSLLTSPDIWSGAMIVGAHPGSDDGDIKSQNLERDRIWAKRFLTEPWDDVLTEWDCLPVFCDRPCTLPRSEADFDRHKIAHAFEAYSKGKMDYLTPQLSRLSVPITYITGSDDHRYSQIGQTLAANCPNLLHIEIPDAGHRVPWEQPEAFMAVLIQAFR